MRALRSGLLVLALVCVALTPSLAFAAPDPVDTIRLSMAEPRLDGATVRFSGEAIGEALKAGGDNRWINVLDEGVAIGVFAPQDAIAGIDGYGEWGREGTRIEVTGVYNVACPDHGGDLDVHATEIKVLAPSAERLHPVRPWKALVALVGVTIAAVLGLRYRALRRRER